MEQEKYPLSMRNTPRYLIAWLFILLIIISSTVALVYNSNAIMMLFGKGHINLRSYSELTEVVEQEPETYQVLSNYVNQQQKQMLVYTVPETESQFIITSDPNGAITQISIHLDITKFQLSNPIALYSNVNDILKPLCHNRDILAAEIAILKFMRNAELLNYSNAFYKESQMDQKEFIISKPPKSLVISVLILP